MRAITIVEFADGEIKIAVNKPHDDPLTPDEVGIALMQYGIAKLLKNVPAGGWGEFTDIPLSEETNSEGEEMPTKRCAWNGYHGAPDGQCTNSAMPGHDLCEFHSQGVIALEEAYSERKEGNSESFDIIPPGEVLHFHGNGMETACSTYHYWGVRTPNGTVYPMNLREAMEIHRHYGLPVMSRSYDEPWEVAV